jgi:hypothetical protein
MLIGALRNQLVNLLAADVRVAPISQLPGMGTKFIAQSPFLTGHVAIRFMMMDCQGFQCRPAPGLGNVPGCDHRVFESVAKFRCKTTHSAISLFLVQPFLLPLQLPDAFK